jgi:mono/diheme cytochrome c family protein
MRVPRHIRHRVVVAVLAIAAFAVASILALAAPAGKNPSNASAEQIEHGRYLVTLGGCNHCHSPKAMSPNGPIPHPMKTLSGHSAESKLPEIPKGVLGPDKWMGMTNGDMTAWVGPWGVSFASNLAPDPATGLGAWTDEVFIKTLRTGKHMGTGRQLLPPMPWQDIGKLTDQDLKDIFAYLTSIPAVRNPVPQPIPPPGDSH